MTRWLFTWHFSPVPDSTPADREPARTDAQAAARFLRFLNRSLSAVHGDAIWKLTSPPQGGVPSAVTVPTVVPLRRRSSEDRIYLRSTLQVHYQDDPRHQGERKVSTENYAHTVGRSADLKPGMYSWEWSAAEPTYPHVHVGRSDPAFHGLGKLHIPTGRVFFEHVLLFLVNEHDVQPARDDWLEVLGDSLHRVLKYSTWGGGLT